MGSSERIHRIEGAVLADCLYLIGQARVKLRTGDSVGAGSDLEAAERLVPSSAVKSVIWQIGRGELPAPEPGPGGMDAWFETCRRAGAGELELTRVLPPGGLTHAEHAAVLARLVPAPPPAPPTPAVESQADFLVRLHQIRLDAEAEMKAKYGLK